MRHLIQTARPIAEDLIGTIAFYLLFLLTGSSALSAAVGLGISLAQIVRHRMRGERVPLLLAVGAVLTGVLAAVTLVMHDPRFVLLKPSIIYGCVGLTMLRRGWIDRYMPAIVIERLPRRSLDRAGWGWAALMIGTAVLNLLMLLMLSPRAAAAIFLVGGTAAKVLLFVGQHWSMHGRARRLG